MATRSTLPSEICVIGIDIGKDVFHLVGFDADGKIVLLSWGVYWTADNSAFFGSFVANPGNQFLNMVWRDPSSVLDRICNM